MHVENVGCYFIVSIGHALWGSVIIYCQSLKHFHYVTADVVVVFFADRICQSDD